MQSGRRVRPAEFLPWWVAEHVRLVYTWTVRAAQRAASGILAAGPLPKHVAFVMDGNRRFADRVRMPIGAGHQQGYSKVLRDPRSGSLCGRLASTHESISRG